VGKNIFDEIKQKGDCRTYLRNVFKIPTVGKVSKEWQHFKYPPWRPQSDSKSFAANKEQWKDH